jgi:dipeptidyl aminopeptidase/acylaminoacyl peptidase
MKKLKPSLQALVVTALTCFIFHASSLQASEPVNQLPAEAFYHLPVLQNLMLSPDGAHLLALKNVGGFTSVMVKNLATGEVFYPTKTDNIEFQFRWVRWAGNDRILLSLGFVDAEHRYGQAFLKTRLLSMDAKHDSKMVAMVQPKSGEKLFSFNQDTIVGVVGTDPGSILMSIPEQDHGQLTAVYKVQLASGKRHIVKKGDIDTSSWFADLNGNVRAGVGMDRPTEKMIIKVLDPRKNEWVVAWTYAQIDEKPIYLLGFGHNPNELYVLADYNGRRAVYKADLMQDGYPLTLVQSEDKYDLYGDLIYLPTRKDVVGITYKSAGETHNLFWNPELKKLQESLIRALPGARSSIVSVSDDLRKYIVFTSDATNPGSFLYGNRDTKELLPLADTYPELNSDNLIKKEYMAFKSRDGIELSGYLSRAKVKQVAAVPAPLIIMPPSIVKRNFNAQFDALSAYLVNLGYSVYQPNISEARAPNNYLSINSMGSLGLLLQNDIEDATKHLINNNIAAPEKMCIVGQEYGGFAAIMASVVTPKLFKCSVSLGGVSNISKMLGNHVYFMHKDTIGKIMGSPEQQLLNATPLAQVEKIKIPILLIHGSDDVDVRVQQSQLMAEELKRLNKTYEYIELKNGTSDLNYLPHRKQAFEAIGSFIQKYLPAE